MSKLSLGEALPLEMSRVRDEVLPAYLEIGAPGLFAATIMRGHLDAAAKAMITGDIVGMLQSYEMLKDCQL